jgi:hypothetical protein
MHPLFPLGMSLASSSGAIFKDMMGPGCTATRSHVTRLWMPDGLLQMLIEGESFYRGVYLAILIKSQ